MSGGARMSEIAALEGTDLQDFSVGLGGNINEMQMYEFYRTGT